MTNNAYNTYNYESYTVYEKFYLFNRYKIDKVLKSINEELSPILNNLQINKVKDKKGRGGKIKYIEFTFDKQIFSIGTKIITNTNHHNTKQPKHLQSRELTPEWLKNPVQHTNEEHDPTLEEDRAKFLEYLRNQDKKED